MLNIKNIYSNPEAKVEIKDNKVYIKSEEPLYGVKISFENTYYSESALILGDAWERAYADLAFRSIDPEKVLPWYFTAKDGNKIYSFGVKTEPNAMCSWKVLKDENYLLPVKTQ